MPKIIREIRKRASVLVSLALLVVICATFLTGFISVALDLNRFVLHKYAAYVAIGLAAAHVALHWRTLVGQVKRWLLGGGRRESAQRGVATGPAPAPATLAGVPRATGVPGFGRRALPALLLGFAAGIGAGRWWGTRATPPVFAEGDDLGQVYHRWSVPSYAGLLTRSIAIRPQPGLYKEYPGAQSVALPPPPNALTGVEEALLRRRSVREYADRPVTIEELSRLLSAATGVTDRRDPTLWFRSVPSSGALYPIELYPVVFDVAGLAPGVYHYDMRRHALTLVRAGDFRREMFAAAVGQEMFNRASLALVLTGIFARVQWKYVERSYRYVLLEAGHLGQNVYLAATALGLGPCGVGAFFDEQVNAIIGIDGREEVTTYLMTVGVA